MSNETVSAPLAIYRFVVTPGQAAPDARSAGYLADAHALGFTEVTGICCEDIYFVEGAFLPADLAQLANRLLADPLAQRISWSAVDVEADRRAHAELIDVALRPGVTDPVAEQIVRAAPEIGVKGVKRACTAQRFYVQGNPLPPEILDLLAKRLLANPIIQRYELGIIDPIFPQEAGASGKVEVLPVRQMNDAQLLQLSADRRAALDLTEMRAIQAYFRAEDRDMTDIELETIAQTWSEHCVHKTFKAQVTIQNPQDAAAAHWKAQAQANNLLKTYLKAATDQINAPWVLSAFVDNAGILAFGADSEVSFKVETHNHPSAIEPFGGANTGVGGVIRDVIGVSAKPIAATDVLCFGPQDLPLEDLPAGVLHPRRIQSGVVAGVQDYGNKIGIPTVSGAVLYDPGFTANPLVFCGCVGIAPRGKHGRDPKPGDRVIVLGGRTGRDGLRGATFSSMTMDAQTGEVAGASVQIGAPITEKGLIDVIVRARDAGLYRAVTDCGAGGLSSAVGEMASGLGATIDLQDVRLKYPGLAPWEIWLSEAQERMVLAVPVHSIHGLRQLCEIYDVEFTDIGVFEATGRLVVCYGKAVTLDLANHFLHEGIPQRHLQAQLPHYDLNAYAPAIHESAETILLKLLAHPNIASKAAIIRIYDHEVQGGTLIKPLTGTKNDGPSDGVVIKPIGEPGMDALILSTGINPEYGKRNPYRMAFAMIDEAVRNAVATGADPAQIAILDNFCWGDPLKPENMGSLIECTRGCYDAATLYGTPFISGKDSFNNEYLSKDGQRQSIPPTLLISAMGIVSSLKGLVTMDLKQPGSAVYLIGKHQPKLAGSHLALVCNQSTSSADIPEPVPAAPQLYAALHAAMQSGWVRACHDLSEGGLAVTAAEMCIAGRLGMEIHLPAAGNADALTCLFGETNACLLVEVAEENKAAFEAQLGAFGCALLGNVTAEPNLTIWEQSETMFTLPVEQLVNAWQRTEAK